jgi:hypothetical protein
MFSQTCERRVSSVLADGGGTDAEATGLRPDLHVASTFRYQLIDFIRGELPKWRDRPDRPIEQAETKLNSQLCLHLNGATRHSTAWSSVQFIPEPPDTAAANRNIDIAAQPSNAVIWIEGMKHSEFDPILPIECKRLPTPVGTKRDEREYLFSQFKSAGGVQRFKAGHHGSKHNLCAMVAYVQDDKIPTWHDKVNGWVNGLAKATTAGWSKGDALSLDEHDTVSRLAMLKSYHKRSNELPDVELRHLWIEM